MEVVAALIFQGERLLVCQRSEQGYFPLKWEFPGGKVERGENYLIALQRELNEELGIGIQSATEVFRHSHVYPDGPAVDIIFFRVSDYRGEVANRVFQRLRWVEIHQLKELDFLDGDSPLIEKLVNRELILSF